MKLIVDSGARTKSDLLSVEFTMQAGDVENITSLPAGWFSDRAGIVLQLKPKAERQTLTQSSLGVVVKFPRK